MHLGHYIELLRHSQDVLSKAYREVAAAHPDEPDVRIDCEKFAEQIQRHSDRLAPVHTRYSGESQNEPERLLSSLFHGTRSGPLGLLRDLHDVYLVASECDLAWTLITQAARGARDTELICIASECDGQVAVQLAWLRSRMKQAAPQALVVER
ncbi:MAG: hypothetical protein JWL72_2838 [Ilumatobacteraceae bacterium]|nr:hypothetical protein [Ilumatobacteraceae bacterium]MCU1389500.1 hypothetical protein [Ilumatobacteraceae bacterium]